MSKVQKLILKCTNILYVYKRSKHPINSVDLSEKAHDL